MHHKNTRHRWIFAVPVVLLLVVCTVREGRNRADLLPGNTERSDVWAGGFLQAENGALFEVLPENTVDLHAGTVLLFAPGLVTVQAGEWAASVWAGPLSVMFDHDRLTVVSFNVPVVAERGDETVILPPFSQWHAPASSLPDAGTDPAAWLRSLEFEPLPAHFRAEQQRRIDAWEQESEGLAAIRSRPLLRFYGLLHPLVRDHLWATMTEEPVTDAETWMSLLMLPRTDRDPQATEAIVVRLWGEYLRAAIDASDDPDALRAALLPLLERDIRALGEDGYPARALRYAEALGLASVTPETFRASVLKQLLQPVQNAVESLAAAPEIPADPTLEARAREQLSAEGVMFTSQSVVRAIGEGAVLVRDVVVGFPSGDRALQFEYLVERHAVRAIVDGATVPYDVPFAAYLAWAAERY